MEDWMTRTIAIGALIALAACDGPRENAGENADFAAGVVNSPDTLRQGPAEKLGEAQDVAAKRAEEAKEAEARSLEAEAKERRAVADKEAEALEQRADQVRND